jgi:hypothetical protein
VTGCGAGSLKPIRRAGRGTAAGVRWYDRHRQNNGASRELPAARAGHLQPIFSLSVVPAPALPATASSALRGPLMRRGVPALSSMQKRPKEASAQRVDVDRVWPSTASNCRWSGIRLALGGEPPGPHMSLSSRHTGAGLALCATPSPRLALRPAQKFENGRMTDALIDLRRIRFKRTLQSIINGADVADLGEEQLRQLIKPLFARQREVGRGDEEIQDMLREVRNSSREAEWIFDTLDPTLN